MTIKLAGIVLLTWLQSTGLLMADDDPYLWLEEIQGEQALAWARERNVESLAELQADSRFENLMLRSLRDYEAIDKIPYSTLLDGMVDNFWQDEHHVRGVWRRSSLADYLGERKHWKTVLDLDRLAEQEGENWIYKARNCLAPAFDRCLLELSRGGGDAVVVREFDSGSGEFVSGGFVSPEAKQNVAWLDRDTVLIGTDFGPDRHGNSSLTDSGYSNQVRLWKRGTPLSAATTVFEGSRTDVVSAPFASHRADGNWVGVSRSADFFSEIVHLFVDGHMQRLHLPESIDFQGIFGDRVLILLREDWRDGNAVMSAGSLVSVNIDDALQDRAIDSLQTVVAAPAKGAIESVSIGMKRVLIATLDTVNGRLLSAARKHDRWHTEAIELPDRGTVSIVSADDWSDRAFVNFESFLQPDCLYLLEADQAPRPGLCLPTRFDAEGLVAEQQFARSADGTRVPYFIIRRKDTPMDGNTPTVLYGYGGFEVSLLPYYLLGFAKLWVEQGGAYVIANIRGGGEFGPRWHQAALKTERQRAYDDFIAVAEQLVDSGLTSPRRLGIRGGSGGGLLVGVITTQRPALFNAVICQVPLLDMLRYHRLLAGASWMGEYGDPENDEERAFLRSHSPYHNLDSKTDYPRVFFYTSTLDDRVHPGHARKMVARMQEMGKDVLYYENIEGGHSAAANLRQRAFTDALETVFVLRQLSDTAVDDKP